MPREAEGKQGNIPRRFSSGAIHFHSLDLSFPFPFLSPPYPSKPSAKQPPHGFSPVTLCAIGIAVHSESIRALLHPDAADITAPSLVLLP